MSHQKQCPILIILIFSEDVVSYRPKNSYIIYHCLVQPRGPPLHQLTLRAWTFIVVDLKCTELLLKNKSLSTIEENLRIRYMYYLILSTIPPHLISHFARTSIEKVIPLWWDTPSYSSTPNFPHSKKMVCV